MGLVLGGRQGEFAQRQQPRVEVKRPGFRINSCPGQFLFQRIGPHFDFRQALRGDQGPEHEELFAQLQAHSRLVIRRLIEGIGRACQGDFAEKLFQALPRPAKRFGMTTKGCDDQEDGIRQSRLGHK